MTRIAQTLQQGFRGRSAAVALEPLSDKMAPPLARSGPARFGLRNLRPVFTEHAAAFAPILTPLRWASLCLALALGLIEHLGARAVLAGGGLVAYKLWRTIRPIGGEQGRW